MLQHRPLATGHRPPLLKQRTVTIVTEFSPLAERVAERVASLCHPVRSATLRPLGVSAPRRDGLPVPPASYATAWAPACSGVGVWPVAWERPGGRGVGVLYAGGRSTPPRGACRLGAALSRAGCGEGGWGLGAGSRGPPPRVWM